MRRITGPDARTVALMAALASMGLLVVLIGWPRQDLLGVAMALGCVLLATISGVAVAAERQRDEAEAVQRVPVPVPEFGGLHGIDADTLETLGDREAVRAVRERYRRRDDLDIR